MDRPSVCIESLESRQLMAFSGAHHVFTIAGVGAQPNIITVGLTPDKSSVFAEITYPFKKTMKTVSVTYPLTRNFNFVKITGGKKSDLITIDQTNGSFPLGTRINTGNGNDTIMGGDEADTVVCGNGYDSVVGGAGDDVLKAGNHASDTLVGGSGAVTLWAGKKGKDVLIAGSGPTTFIDPFRGYNTLQGSDAPDQYILYNKQISADPINTYDPAKDKLLEFPKKQVDIGSLVGEYLGDVLDYL